MRLIRFLLFGGTAAVLNIVLMLIAVDLLRFDTVFLRNTANVISVEICMLYSFFVYRRFVWNDIIGTTMDGIWKQLATYHVSAGLAILLRFITFPILDLCQVHHIINTLIGISISSLLNYVISNRYVFKQVAESNSLSS